MTRPTIARLVLPAAAALLLLSACSSGEATPTPPAASPSVVVEQPMASDDDDAMASSDAMSSSDAMASSDAMTGPGSYIDLADYQAGKDMYDAGTVVLFFHASWCPTCKATEENLDADPAGIPEGLAIVKVDFDNSDDLRQKYGVTTQHTFVQVDADGTELAKWTGTLTAQDIDTQTA